MSVAELAREPLGTAWVTRGGRELSAAVGGDGPWHLLGGRGELRGSGWAAPVGGGCRAFAAHGAARRGKWRRKPGSFCHCVSRGTGPLCGVWGGPSAWDARGAGAHAVSSQRHPPAVGVKAILLLEKELELH